MAVRRTLGLGAAVAIVVGNMIGSGVFLLPASMAPYGGLAFAGWLLSAAGSLSLALVFAWLARVHPAAGGPYAFTRQAFGDLPAFLVAWGYWISSCASNGALAVAFIAYLDPFVPALVARPAVAGALAVAAVWVVTIVNVAGVRAAARVQVVTTIVKIVPIVVIGVAGVLAFQPAHFAVPASMPASPGGPLMAVVTLTLFAFLGLECATVPADAIRDPARVIPRATIVGTAIAAALYMLGTAGVMSVIAPADLGAAKAPFADAARILFGAAAAKAVAAGAAISCLGALNGWVLMAGELPRAVARDRLFPRAFARESAQGTPIVGLVTSGVITTALVAMNYAGGLVSLFTFVLLLSTLSSLVPYVFCALAWFLTTGPRPPARAIVASIAFVFSIVAIAGAGTDVVYWGFLLLLLGLPVYAAVVLANRRPSA